MHEESEATMKTTKTATATKTQRPVVQGPSFEELEATMMACLAIRINTGR
jgi:hypothetical protein